MKKTLLILTLLSTVSLFAGNAKIDKKAKRILAKSIKASGGKSALRKITSITQKAVVTIKQQNIKIDITSISTGNKIYTEANVMNMKSVSVYNGKDAWAKDMTNGLRDLKGGEKMSLLLGTLQVAKFPERFFDSISYVGIKKFNKKKTLALVFKKKEFEDIMFYFDSKTFLAEGMVYTLKSPMGEMKTTTTFLSYKKSQSGLLYADKTEVAAGPMTMTSTITEYLENKKIDSSIFEKPKN